MVISFMNAREFITKIINKSQGQIYQRVKSLPKLLSVCLISTIALLPLSSMPNRGITAYAQQATTTITDPWYQSVEVARSKVEAALTPGAFGHGVPGLHSLTTSDILMTFGICVLASIVVFVAIRGLPKYITKEKLGRVSLLDRMA